MRSDQSRDARMQKRWELIQAGMASSFEEAGRIIAAQENPVLWKSVQQLMQNEHSLTLHQAVVASLERAAEERNVQRAAEERARQVKEELDEVERRNRWAAEESARRERKRVRAEQEEGCFKSLCILLLLGLMVVAPQLIVAILVFIIVVALVLQRRIVSSACLLRTD